MSSTEDFKQNFDTDFTDSDFINFVGLRNTEYYFKKWKNNKDKNCFISWNWASFFLGLYWLLYRKLYAWFIGIAIIDTVCVSLISIYNPIIAGLIPLIIAILLGIFGNSIYIKHTKKKIKSLKTFFDKYGDTKEVLEANGGTTLVAPIVLLAISTVVTIVSTIFLTTFLSSLFYSFF